MKKIGFFGCLLVALTATCILTCCKREKVVTFRSLLRDMSMSEVLTRYPEPGYRLVQFSSYDRRSIHPDSAGWFANNDYTHFIREEFAGGRHEYVMADAEGPGAIVRWWMTFGNENALNSYIRVYIDGSSTPVIEGMAPQLVGEGIIAPAPLSSSVSPLTEPRRRGYNLYLPIPFSEKCIITLENDSVVIIPPRRTPSIYYNIDMRLYEEGTRVESLNHRSVHDDSLAIAACASNLLSPRGIEKDDDLKKVFEGDLAPGEELALPISIRGYAIAGFSVMLNADDTVSALKETYIRMAFDGKQTVSVPAGSFFGTGYSFNSYRTRFTAADHDGVLSSFWLMPFRDSCRISLFNGATENISMMAEMTLTPYKWDNSSMHFGVSWREYTNWETAGSEHTGGTGQHADVTIAGLKGRGVYAGDAITIFNTADAWWGEGDEKIYVDGEIFPSSFGTGTEDYFGYAWCRPEHFDHPFIAQPAGFGNIHPGMSVNMRYRILDAIPFTQSIKANLEMWHWVKTTVSFSLTSYYYLIPE